MSTRSRINNVDHLVISVSDFERSRRFYGSLFKFFGMKVLEEYEGATGWKNGNSRFWIYQAGAKGRRRKHRVGDDGLKLEGMRYGRK